MLLFFQFVWEGWNKEKCPVGIFGCQCAIKEVVLLSESLCVTMYSHECFCGECLWLEGIICWVVSFMVFSFQCSAAMLNWYTCTVTVLYICFNTLLSARIKHSAVCNMLYKLALWFFNHKKCKSFKSMIFFIGSKIFL